MTWPHCACFQMAAMGWGRAAPLGGAPGAHSPGHTFLLCPDYPVSELLEAPWFEILVLEEKTSNTH